MLEFKHLEIARIYVSPTRSRKVNEDHALAINAQIVSGDFIDPILVRKTPRRSEQPYELIDGAHRLRAMALLDEEYIPCVIAEADKDTAELMETGSNLFRHMTVLDRAIAIHLYRQAWERKHGKIKRGNPELSNSDKLSELKNSDKLSEFSHSPIDILSAEAQRGFSVQCAERMGMSARSVERSVQIATRLPADLVGKIVGTAIADNQSQLLNLARLPFKKRQAAAEIFDLAKGDFDRWMELLEVKEPVEKPSAAIQAYSRIVDSWGRIGPEQKWQTLDDIGVADLLTDAQKAVLAKRFGGAAQ